MKENVNNSVIFETGKIGISKELLLTYIHWRKTKTLNILQEKMEKLFLKMYIRQQLES